MTTPDLDATRERLREPLHQAIHDLDVRIANLPVDGCHCNLVAEVVLDALMPLVGVLTTAKVEAENAALRDAERRVRHALWCWTFLDEDEVPTIGDLRDQVLAALGDATAEVDE